MRVGLRVKVYKSAEARRKSLERQVVCSGVVKRIDEENASDPGQTKIAVWAWHERSSTLVTVHVERNRCAERFTVAKIDDVLRESRGVTGGE